MGQVLLSPLVAFMAFLLLAYSIHWLGGQIAATGEAHGAKHTPYTGGEEVAPPERQQLTYHAFFRLALMFSILHVAALVVSTLPGGLLAHRVALVYLVGIGISVLVLAEG